jgi:alpha-tubulin suppressor-like RCC1 family protein
MTTMIPPRSSVLLAALLCGGCASILGADFDEGRMREPGRRAGDVDGGQTTVPPPEAPVNGTCAADRKLCETLCFSVDDPSRGCRGASCAPCPAPAGGRATCESGQCGVACNVGFHPCAEGCCAAITPVSPRTIALAWRSSCAITPSGGVKCWGYGLNGELGNGLTVSSPTPVQVTGLTSSVVSLAAGYFHMCALMAGGGVKCWGANANGQLGDPSVNPRALTPVNVTGLGGPVVAIAAGHVHTCALTKAGGVKCWGFNSRGQLGNGGEDTYRYPVDVFDLRSGVKAIAASRENTCALTATGTVKCWGDNTFVQLGNLAAPRSLVPVDVPLGTTAEAIAVGSSHVCALTTAGGVKCWGSNRSAELSDTQVGESRVPVDVYDLSSGVVAITAGGNNVGEGATCARGTGGGLRCWGNNRRGALGNGVSGGPYWMPSDVETLTSGVGDFALGADHGCARLGPSALKCWGDNQYGGLGNSGAANPSEVPVDVLSFP